MKIEKMVNIRFTEAEVVLAMVQYLKKRGKKKLAKHVDSNFTCVDIEDDEFVLCVDGILDE